MNQLTHKELSYIITECIKSAEYNEWLKEDSTKTHDIVFHVNIDEVYTFRCEDTIILNNSAFIGDSELSDYFFIYGDLKLAIELQSSDTEKELQNRIRFKKLLSNINN